MKIQKKGIQMLKKVDDTVPKQKKPKVIPSPLISKQKSKKKRQSKKILKVLPGQTILSFKTNIIKSSSQTLEFICVDQKTMGWPQQFTKKIIPHKYDNDQQSTDYVVTKQVQKGIATLVEEITFKRILEMEDTMGF